MQISHEAIYRSLFVQARGVLKNELVRRLPAELRKSLTWNRGMEMARHKDSLALYRSFGMVQNSSVGSLPLLIWTHYFGLGHFLMVFAARPVLTAFEHWRTRRERATRARVLP
jgi:hypothetical protein